MAVTFTLLGENEPFLHCHLQQGDIVHCEANAMVMMESNLELKGSLQGGIMQSLMRRFANGESLFQQKIEATRGEGDCLLAPTLDGDMQILDIGNAQYTLSDGAFVASSVAWTSKPAFNAIWVGRFLAIQAVLWSCKRKALDRWWCQALACCLRLR